MLSFLKDRTQIFTAQEYLYAINITIFDLLNKASIPYTTVDPFYNYGGFYNYGEDLIKEEYPSNSSVKKYLNSTENDFNYIFFSEPTVNQDNSLQATSVQEYATRINLKIFTEAFSREIEESVSYISELILSDFYYSNVYDFFMLLDFTLYYSSEQQKQKNEEKFSKVFNFLLTCNNYLDYFKMSNYDERELDDVQ